MSRNEFGLSIDFAEFRANSGPNSSEPTRPDTRLTGTRPMHRRGNTWRCTAEGGAVGGCAREEPRSSGWSALSHRDREPREVLGMFASLVGKRTRA